MSSDSLYDLESAVIRLGLTVDNLSALDDALKGGANAVREGMLSLPVWHLIEIYDTLSRVTREMFDEVKAAKGDRE